MVPNEGPPLYTLIIDAKWSSSVPLFTLGTAEMSCDNTLMDFYKVSIYLASIWNEEFSCRQQVSSFCIELIQIQLHYFKNLRYYDDHIVV